MRHRPRLSREKQPHHNDAFCLFSAASCKLPHQQDALPGHPSYGQHRPALDAVVVAAVKVSAHPEVGDLDGESSVQQAVPGGQVAVHKVQGRQVLHPRRDLHRHV